MLYLRSWGLRSVVGVAESVYRVLYGASSKDVDVFFFCVASISVGSLVEEYMPTVPIVFSW